jgi:hypothetical protein
MNTADGDAFRFGSGQFLSSSDAVLSFVAMHAIPI